MRNVVGSSKAMHDQLLQVVLLAAMHDVSPRVVPGERAEQGALGSEFQMMIFKRHAPLVHLDNSVSGLFVDRDSKNAGGPMITLPHPSWHHLLSSVGGRP